MAKRISGFYWIRIQDVWSISDYDSEKGEWWLLGNALPMLTESVFDEIGDLIEEPKKQ